MDNIFFWVWTLLFFDAKFIQGKGSVSVIHDSSQFKTDRADRDCQGAEEDSGLKIPKLCGSLTFSDPQKIFLDKLFSANL